MVLRNYVKRMYRRWLHVHVLQAFPLVISAGTVITKCSRVLFEKLIAAQLVKKFRAFYGTRKSITVFTKAHQ
jgi:RNase P protein component